MIIIWADLHFKGVTWLLHREEICVKGRDSKQNAPLRHIAGVQKKNGKTGR